MQMLRAIGRDLLAFAVGAGIIFVLVIASYRFIKDVLDIHEPARTLIPLGIAIGLALVYFCRAIGLAMFHLWKD